GTRAHHPVESVPTIPWNTHGKITATFAAPLFPKFVLLLSVDTMIGLVAVIIVCALASVVAIRMALKVDPAEAIGG
ncbi:hypothetical protein ACFONL_20900, partial [Camelimonas fluminis]